MIPPTDDRTPPMTPQLALRVAIIGTVALALFAVIFFRLWFLQVLSDGQYVAYAQRNTTRRVPVAAPRGEILSSDGSVLVDSVPEPAIQIVPLDLPAPLSFDTLRAELQKHRGAQPRADYAVYDELAPLLGMSTKPRPCTIWLYLGGPPVRYRPRLAQIPCLVAQGIANAQYAPVTIKTDVSRDISFYIQERQTTEHHLQGVVPTNVYLRSYRHGALAAQALGYVQPVSTRELHQKNFSGAKPGDIVGQSGLEYQYNPELRGTDGYDVVKVNAQNEFEGYAKPKRSLPGDNLETSLNLRLQEVGEKALAKSIQIHPGATSGAFVAMNPQNGQVYAMGSLPSYDPSEWVPAMSKKHWAFLQNPANNYPLLNRAIDGALPDGSTFKVITATAALQTGVWGVDQPYFDSGQFCYPHVNPALPGSCIHNSGGAANGYTALEPAIQISDDVYFYHLGYLLYERDGANPKQWPLQKWASAYGIGRPTGIDLPGESAGILPTLAYLKRRYREELACEGATGAYAYTNGHGLLSAKPKPGFHRSPKHPASQGGCGISNADLSYWNPGDTVEMGVGQGDDEVTPMQLGVAYAAIENGGRIVTPHIGQAIVSPSGQVIQKIDPGIRRTLPIDAGTLDAIRTGLHEAAQTPQGTSGDVMGNFPLPVYGKTGTAEIGTNAQVDSNTAKEDAWYACYVPASATSKPILVVVNVEDGGFGDVAAAPVARQILSQWFLGRPGPFVTGSSSGNPT